MLLNSVILVLREVLEAAVLVSVLLALSSFLGQRKRWVLWCLPLALLGSIWLAFSMDTLTDALDGTGQEVFNATLQLLVFLCVVGIIFIEGIWVPAQWSLMRGLMIGAVTLAMVREGGEIWIYVSGFASVPEMRTAVLTGSAMGAGIGLSFGVLLYSALRALPLPWQRPSSLVLLALSAAGMVMQATLLLEQVGWLDAGQALWDSSHLVSESSIAGELLYAVFGYEATPGAVQGLLYAASLLTVLAAHLCSRFLRSRFDGR